MPAGYLASAGLDLFSNLLNFGLVERNNAQRERLAREAMGIANGSIDALGDPESYIRGTPAGDPNFNIGDYYPAYRRDSLKDAVSGYLGEGVNFGDVSRDIGRLYEGERYAPGKRAEDVGKLFPAEQFDAYLASELDQIGAGSRARTTTGRQNVLSRGLAGGQDLNELGGDLEQLEYGEQLGRATQATGARAAQEGMRAQSNIARANAQTSAMMTQAGINEALARSQGELGLESARAGENQRFNDARMRSEATAYDIDAAREDYATDREAMLDRFAQLVVAPRLQANTQANAAQQSTDFLMAQILAGYSPSLPQFDFSGTQNFLTSTAAARESRPRSNPFSFGIAI